MLDLFVFKNPRWLNTLLIQPCLNIFSHTCLNMEIVSDWPDNSVISPGCWPQSGWTGRRTSIICYYLPCQIFWVFYQFSLACCFFFQIWIFIQPQLPKYDNYQCHWLGNWVISSECSSCNSRRSSVLCYYLLLSNILSISVIPLSHNCLNMEITLINLVKYFEYFSIFHWYIPFRECRSN
jgi:hypothetical protein